MPDVTSEDVFSGRIGLILVFARLNDISAARAMPPPTMAMAMAVTTRTRNGNSMDGAVREANHIAVAISNATTGGGIFSSSVCMWRLLRSKTARVTASVAELPSQRAVASRNDGVRVEVHLQ